MSTKNPREGGGLVDQSYLPEGMSLAEFRKHPVASTIKAAGYYGERGIPDARELDSLGLSETDRRKVEKAAKRAAAIHDTGDHLGAWTEADQSAGAILDLLPEAQRDPSYLTPDPDPPTHDPRELAQRISRH